MNRLAILFVATTLVIVVPPPGTGAQPAPPAETQEPASVPAPAWPAGTHGTLDKLVDEPCHPHSPLLIDGDGDFTWANPATGATEPRPGSGVVGGQGTQQDPYVIEGWCIVAPSLSKASGVAGITLANTSAHVVVRNNVVLSPSSTETHTTGSVGIWLDEAENVQVRGNQVHGQGSSGLLVSSASGNEVTGNLLHDNHGPGIHFEHAPENRADGNLVLDNEGNGVAVQGEGNVLEGNTVQHSGLDGIHVYDADTVLRNNLVLANDHNGLRVTAGNVLLEENRIEGNGWTAVRGDSGLTLANNTIRSNGGSASFRGPVKDVTIESNQFADNDAGLVLDNPYNNVESGDIVISDNNFEAGDAFGLYADDLDEAPNVEANWWGHEGGPSGGVESSCNGNVADGEGRSILTDGAQLCLGPWRTEPNPAAGAG